MDNKAKILLEENISVCVCRFCLLSCNENAVLRIPWNEWQHSLLAAMYERIMNQELYMSKECPEFCCNKCSQLLSETVAALDMFQRSDLYWREMLIVPKAANSPKPEYIEISEGEQVAEQSRQQESSLFGIEFIKIEPVDDFLLEFDSIIDKESNTVNDDFSLVKVIEKIDTLSEVPKIQTINARRPKKTIKRAYKSSKSVIANDAPFPCSQCDELCRTRYILTLHMSKTHGLKLCVRCNFTAPDRFALKHHDLAEHKRTIDTISVCTKCSRVFTDPYRLQQHMKMVHSDPLVPSQCHICSKIFRSARKLQQHVETHSEKTLKCDICSKMFRLKKHIVWHMQNSHIRNVTCICTKCGKKFSDHGAWKQHENRTCPLILSENPLGSRALSSGRYACSLCDRKFSDLPYSRKHYRKEHHIADMSIICMMCNYLAFSADDLAKHHDKMHTDLRCTVCKRYYNSDIALKLHIAKHSTKERSFVCSICDAAFVKLAALKTHHKRVHTTDRPFKCTDCDLRFAENCEMKSHWRHKHNKNKKLQCQLCEKRFVTMSALKVHEEIHTGIGQKCCELCPMQFRHIYQLTVHMKKDHFNNF